LLLGLGFGTLSLSAAYWLLQRRTRGGTSA
jgi:hypothetical protein